MQVSKSWSIVNLCHNYFVVWLCTTKVAVNDALPIQFSLTLLNIHYNILCFLCCVDHSVSFIRMRPKKKKCCAAVIHRRNSHRSSTLFHNLTQLEKRERVRNNTRTESWWIVHYEIIKLMRWRYQEITNGHHTHAHALFDFNFWPVNLCRWMIIYSIEWDWVRLENCTDWG